MTKFVTEICEAFDIRTHFMDSTHEDTVWQAFSTKHLNAMPKEVPKDERGQLPEKREMEENDG